MRDLLSFWERFSFGRPGPQRDWVGLLDVEAAYERDTGDVRVWRFPDGDGVGVFVFDLEPDLPRLHDPASFVSRTRDRVAASGVALVECEVVRVASIPLR